MRDSLDKLIGGEFLSDDETRCPHCGLVQFAVQVDHAGILNVECERCRRMYRVKVTERGPSIRYCSPELQDGIAGLMRRRRA